MRNFEGLCTKNSPDSIEKISGHDDNIPTTQQKEREPNGVTNSDEPGLVVHTGLKEMENSLENCTSTSKDASHVGKPDIVENISVLSRSRENSLQGLNKMGHIPSLTKHGNRAPLDRISSASQSKPKHHAQKSILSVVAKITEPGERNGKHLLQGSSKLLYTEKKTASIMIPQKYPYSHPSLQVSRPMAKNGKSPTILKQTNKRLFSSSKETLNFSTNISISKNIQDFTEQKNTALSPLPPLKRKPVEMCKMLKKKHEEAKDLLVRAIVHNNLLLMLNHPLHEEKMQEIQKHVARMFPEGCRK